ncbi:hypothetical protein OPV22_030368 [Ensete ventricosum]|uniref:Uncharacterized protein n=1 Tax=Ensete ventricosum TaxID=4639 RepID=A0AAV8Q5X2_ENSVE|nr:hypothetical protein OPV22_030368 [Ensete ventricosum]
MEEALEMAGANVTKERMTGLERLHQVLEATTKSVSRRPGHRPRRRTHGSLLEKQLPARKGRRKVLQLLTDSNQCVRGAPTPCIESS